MSMATTAQLQKLAIIRGERYVSRGDWFEMVEFELGKKLTTNKALSFNDASHLLTVLDAPLPTEESDASEPGEELAK
jgi:hypothetical protein